MCLAVPGKLVDVYEQDGMPMGKADFGGIRKEVCLACTPEAGAGDWVIVHVGFALSRLDEAEAQAVLSTFDELGGAQPAREPTAEAEATSDEVRPPLS
jgi:hydrogenase expression/formation protein HypC